MVDDEAELTIAALARRAAVSRRFIYDHPEIRAEFDLVVARRTSKLVGRISSEVRVSQASLAADLANSRAEVHRLRQRLSACEHRLGEMIGAETLSQAFGEVLPDWQERSRELELENSGLHQTVRRLEQELEAARVLNRRLTAELNRTA